MASSLAAEIKKNLGIIAGLEEGHGGIFQVLLGEYVIYNNQGKCGCLPRNEEVLERIMKQMQDLKQKKKEDGEVENSECCCSTSTIKDKHAHAANCCSFPSEDLEGDGYSSCCSSEKSTSDTTPSQKRRLDIEFMYIDLTSCTRCLGTETSLEEAISEAARVLEATGVEVFVHNIHVQSEEQARKLGFVSSPTIRINGRDIQLDVRENLCESCGDICGEDIDCRVWVYRGQEYTVPPKAMIIESILREIYGGTKENELATPFQAGDVPENLKRFFTAKKNLK